ncbi:flagellar hook assembly protein FlgD [Allosphingosinicella sp.]|jgi:flagellar basal-body rod modification protein FlgD|uniref:flagellar hook assembly protein FlgD n=1 Tax=Allosphingosinicella sp. TaxID=2823234 RepID=UPI002F06D612
MALAPVSPRDPAQSSAYGLDFQSLLRIILTQLTYQDPLKPVDNFQFVSQLAQFSQLQQSQTLNDQITGLLSAQSAMQATGLIGRTVEYASASGPVSGAVQSVSFASGQPEVTIRTTAGDILANISIANISQVR